MRNGLRNLILALVLLFASVAETRSQLDPNHEKHIHVEYVKECMKPFLERCLEPSRHNATHELNFRPMSHADVVEIAPPDSQGFKDSALKESERQLLFELATCVAFVGQKDPFAETENPPKFDWTLTEETIEKVWATPFDAQESMPHSHAEERHFKDTDGGNRVVFMQEFLQVVLPDLYWKIRNIAGQAVQAGKAAGLFDYKNSVAVSKLGIRNIEYLVYNSGNGYESKLGWHDDKWSTYTMVFMLDEPGKSFEGGKFHIDSFRGKYYKDNDEWLADKVVLNPSLGSGVLFDSETQHQVASVTRGRRRVIVFEFWPYGDTDVWEWRPDPEDVSGQPTLDKVPEGCVLEHGLYQRVCWQ